MERDRRYLWSNLALVMAAGLLLGGCAGRQQAEPGVQEQKVEVVKRARALAQAQAQAQAEVQAHADARQREVLVLESVYFDYRKAKIREDQKKVLLRHADKLKAHPEVKVTLEGHCDDRGSKEYNTVLGMKRAESVKKFLAGQGIAPERAKTVSYGEERPVDRGRTEAARARNRRVEFAVEQPGQ